MQNGGSERKTGTRQKIQGDRKFRVTEKSASKVNGRARIIIANNVLSCALWYVSMKYKAER